MMCRPSWSPAAATKEALIWLAEQGDVQSAVSMYIALSGGRNSSCDRVRGLIDNEVLEHWWLSYVELLHRLQLFTVANKVLSLSSLPAVHNRLHCLYQVRQVTQQVGRGLVVRQGLRPRRPHLPHEGVDGDEVGVPGRLWSPLSVPV